MSNNVVISEREGGGHCKPCPPLPLHSLQSNLRILGKNSVALRAFAPRISAVLVNKGSSESILYHLLEGIGIQIVGHTML